MYTPNTRLIDLTVGELEEVVSNVLRGVEHGPTVVDQTDWVHGLAGIARFLGVSKATLIRRRNAGELKCIVQNLKMISAPKDKLFEEWQKIN